MTHGIREDMYKLVAGTELTPQMRQQVMSAFPYRWTHENGQRLTAYKPCPSCDIKNPHVDEKSSKGHNHPTIPLISDDQWIREHAFNFTLDGRLGRGHAEPAYLAQHNTQI